MRNLCGCSCTRVWNVLNSRFKTEHHTYLPQATLKMSWPSYQGVGEAVLLLTGPVGEDTLMCPLQPSPFVFTLIEASMAARPLPVMATGLVHVLSIGSGTWNASPGSRCTGMADCGAHSPLSLLRFPRELRAELTAASTCCSSRGSMLGWQKRLALSIVLERGKKEPQTHSSAVLGRLSVPAAVSRQSLDLPSSSGDEYRGTLEQNHRGPRSRNIPTQGLQQAVPNM